MNIQHINLKILIRNSAEVKLERYSEVFNGWIQRQVTDELLVDVADYLHVHNGPGMLLIGHEANYSLDNEGGRLGLLYNRKAQLEGPNLEKLVHSARAALQAARLLEMETGMSFDGGEVQVVINDRLIAPNTLETFSTLEPDLCRFAETLFGGTKFSLVQDASDPRRRFRVSVQTSHRQQIETLLANVSVEPEHQHA